MIKSFSFMSLPYYLINIDMNLLGSDIEYCLNTSFTYN